MSRQSAHDPFHPKTCPYCTSPVEFVSKRALYQVSPAKAMVYRCSRASCDAYIGCRAGTDIAIGTLANPETRRARREAYACLNAVIESGRMSKNEAYAWLENLLGLPYNRRGIGWLDDHECKILVKACRDILSNSRYEASIRGIASLRALFDAKREPQSEQPKESKTERFMERYRALTTPRLS
jgi:hypothetical protein